MRYFLAKKYFIDKILLIFPIFPILLFIFLLLFLNFNFYYLLMKHNPLPVSKCTKLRTIYHSPFSYPLDFSTLLIYNFQNFISKSKPNSSSNFLT